MDFEGDHQPETTVAPPDAAQDAVAADDDFPELFDSVTTYFDQREAVAAQVLTGRLASPLYLSCDYQTLSEYQMLVRKQIELFEANCDDVDANAQGRNKPVTLGQVGIRCRHCAYDQQRRTRGAVYYPSKLESIYQAAQHMASIHLVEHCPRIPADVRAQLLQLRQQQQKSSSGGGGKRQWAEKARALGVREDEHGLRFEPCINCSSTGSSLGAGGGGGAVDTRSLASS